MREDTILCPQSSASLAVDLLAAFETITGEAFADTPGTLLKNRVAGFGKVLGNITREVVFDPPPWCRLTGAAMVALGTVVPDNLLMALPGGCACWKRRVLLHLYYVSVTKRTPLMRG